ncbi:TraR/DksA C4-type zinc finger protein [Leucobacter sp. gxy201]|uniref:TraR/DksA family transcriptional regulator n=1 Tax=Leucobacter sp. gxy201 TaxID=2957200 RepID=UPI003DA199D9
MSDASTGVEALLVLERQHALERVAKLEADLDALTRARRSESDDDEHDPEGETLSAQWSLRAGLLEDARATLRQVDAALERLAAGSYGVCVVCGNRIPEGQLEARPFREQCVKCA